MAASRRAFTLIELTVIVALVAFFAALVVPNLASQKEGRIRREFYHAATRLINQARESAIEQKQPILMTYDDANRQLSIAVDTDLVQQLQTLQGTTDQQKPTSLSQLTRTDSQQQTSGDAIQTVTLPDGITSQEFQQNGQTVSSADWKLRFFPDGHADAGGFTVSDDQVQHSFEITRLGSARLSDGPLPDPSAERWQAGDYEHRQ